MNRTTTQVRNYLALVLLAAAPKLMAQAAPQPAAAVSETAEDTITLDPFSVSASEENNGYQVKDTLAGTRVRTDLRDVASAITVINAQFLRDTGSTNSQDLLVYTPSTEVAGMGGNFAGVGNVFINGSNETSGFARPSQNTRVRGLDSADTTRDYFLSYIPWDSYIVDRVDLQRGPNSILFGMGSPAGIVNTSLNTAGYKTAGKLETRLGSFGSFRVSGDYNYVLKKNVLAARFAFLDDNTQFRQNPAYNHDKRFFGSLRWDPKIFGNGNRTTVRANFEHGTINANRPRTLPPLDYITTWFDKTRLNKATFDPYAVWDQGIMSYSSSALAAGQSKNYWITQYMGPGLQMTNNPAFYYDSGSTSTVANVREASPATRYGLKSDGTVDQGIDGFPFGSVIGIRGYGEYGKLQLPGGAYNVYKDVRLTDPTIFDFYNNLIDGPNKYEKNNWNALSLSLEQFFLNNRLGIQVFMDKQNYFDAQARNIGDPYISVDILKYTMDYPSAYSTATLNPNVGRAFIGSGTSNGGSSFRSNSLSWRGTVTGEVRADDFLAKGTLSDLLGRHVFTGLYQHDSYKTDSRNWVRYAIDQGYAAATGITESVTDFRNGGARMVDWVAYLSGNLSGATTASGLNLQPITAEQSPSGTYTVKYYNSNWNYSKNVNPGAAWTNIGRIGSAEGASTQSENPANYIGWTTGQYNVLNADKGDENLLYTDVSKLNKVIDSKAITYQAYLFNEMVVPTIGVRRDVLSSRAGTGKVQASTGSVNPDFSVTDDISVSKGNNTSWGVVFRLPKSLRGKLPLESDISLSYNRGKNMRVENRYGFSGAKLPNSRGDTTDYGVIVTLLDEKVQIKANWFKTTVTNANMNSVSSETSTLGNNTYYLRNLEGWGAATSLMNKAGNDNKFGGWEWFWNYALVDSGWDSAYNDPTTALYKNHPSTKKQMAATADWFATVNKVAGQSFFDAYGFAIDANKLAAGDLTAIGNGWTPSSGVGGVQPSGGGRVNGYWPTGLVNNESKGVELEVSASPIKNLNLSLNASKVTASMTKLGAEITDFIELMHTRLNGGTYNGNTYSGAAGDLRLWWGGGDPFRKTFNENIWAPYNFLLSQQGSMVGEMSPWRFNGIANYNFDKGLVKGLNVGGGYRWSKGDIQGYALKADGSGLDVSHPYWGEDQGSLDLWAGYGRKVSSKINWRIQLNLRNVGESRRLITYSVQPDGSAAGVRIAEGMTWNLTNTFEF